MKSKLASTFRVLSIGILALLMAADSGPSEPPECSVEAARAFNGKVHVILQNACMNCHVASKGAFQMRRGDAVANLSAALKQVDRKQPSASPLLRHTVLAHGGLKQPPIKDASAPAFKHLEAWVKLVAGPQKQETVTEETKSSDDAGNQPVRDPFDPAIFNRAMR